MNEKPKFRRSLRNIRFMKGSRLRLVFAIMTSGMILSAGMLASVLHDVDRGLSHIPTQDLSLLNFVDQIRGTLSGVLMMGLVLNIVTAVLSLLFGLLVSHVFYGPQIPLARHLRELGEGKFSSRVDLRPGDELTDLMTEQNKLAEALQAKFGK
jgi:methyl-accepting chemotaxis protein